MPKFGVIRDSTTALPQPPQPPSLIQQAVNLGGAVVRHLSNGLKQVSPETKESRLKICRGCEFFKEGPNPSCNKCGCFLDVKTAWASESCPEKKWDVAEGMEAPNNPPCGGCLK